MDRTTDDAEDARLAESACEGDSRAFERLLERHESRVMRVLRLMGVPRCDREDLAQDVFVRVFRSLGRFDARRSFRSWIYRIAVNVAHDHRVRLGRRPERPGFAEDWPVSDAPPERGHTGVEERLELRRRLERALEVLTERERAIFVLTEIEGCDTREVGRALGITRITVRRHLSRARERLRVHLAAAPDSVSRK